VSCFFEVSVLDPQENSPRKIVPIVPVTDGANGNDDVQMVSLYAATQKIYPRSVQGIFAKWRWLLVALTQLFFYGLPWLEWGQRQAVLFDLGARRFYIFGIVLYPQDFIYLTAILVISAFSLFLFTAIAGRLWCGYACPQTVYSEIFLWVERKIEGDRTARMKLDAADMSLEKLVKKWYKHIVWLGISIWTGFTFVGYFSPIRELGMEFFLGNMSSWEVFWVFFYALATYGNAGFMREQVCKYMCPYARFQSAMFDKDTLIQKSRSCSAGFGLLRGLQPVCSGVSHRHRYSKRVAVRMHRLRSLRRCVRHRDGQGGLPPWPGEVFDRKRHDPWLEQRADLAQGVSPTRHLVFGHFGIGRGDLVHQPCASQAIQGGRGA
jgi:4Fe-4S binding domain/4Fe-4S dicluster domain